MGHTNSTANLALPQFIGTDKPTWLGDINGAFAAIDAYAGTNDAAVAAAVSDASSAISQASTAVNTANTANTTAGNASTAANNAVGVANTANAIAGTVDAKVGLLADLNTTDRTNIVNAINEIEGEVNKGSVTVTADGIKTAQQLLEELYALIDPTKMSENSVIYYNDLLVYHLNRFTSTGYHFECITSTSSHFDIYHFAVQTTSGYRHIELAGSGNTIDDKSADILPVSTDIKLVY